MADINQVISTIKASGLPQSDKDFIIGKLSDASLSPGQKGSALAEFLDMKIDELEAKTGAAQTATVEDAQKKLEMLQSDLDKALDGLDAEVKSQ